MTITEQGRPNIESTVRHLGTEVDGDAVVLEQIKNGEFFIVSHAYNMVRIDRRYEEVASAFARYAPRYDGDEEYDVRTLVARMSQADQAS